MSPSTIRPGLRSLIALTAFCAGLTALPAAEGHTDFAPRIQSVIVYPDRALVTRSIRMRMGRGKHVLVFRQASPNLEPASLRAFSGDADLIIQGINSYVERNTAARDPRVRELETKVDRLERTQEGLELERARLRTDLKGVDRYSDYFSRMIAAGSTGRASAEETARWRNARSFLLKRKERSAGELRGVERRIDDTREAVGIARRDLRRLQTENAKAVRIVEITLNARKAATAAVGFSYMIRGASWNVSYGMYLKERKRVLVEYYGNIKQKTGEDWKNVTLRLSTSSPAHGAARPKLRPLAVSARKVETQMQVQQVEGKAEETEAETESPSEPTDGTTGPGDFTAVEGDGTSLVFRVSRPVNMESGERSHRVSVSRFETTPKDFHYRLAPGVRRTAVLAARITNSRGFPLLAGAVDVYRASGFIGRSRVKYIPPGASFLMGFGAERDIKITRSLRRYRDESGVLSARKRFHTKVTLEIKNEARDARKLTMIERIPVSELEEVVVTVLPETTSGFKQTKKNSGLLQWDFTMRPGAKRKVVLSFRVDVPESMPGNFYGK